MTPIPSKTHLLRYRFFSVHIPKWIMSNRTSRFRHALRIALFVGTASAAFASQSPTLMTSPKTPLCYCKCEHETGKKCTKMCELPQYENRWWATSCHKKSVNPMTPMAPPSNTGSHKSNRAQDA